MVHGADPHHNVRRVAAWTGDEEATVFANLRSLHRRAEATFEMSSGRSLTLRDIAKKCQKRSGDESFVVARVQELLKDNNPPKPNKFLRVYTLALVLGEFAGANPGPENFWASVLERTPKRTSGKAVGQVVSNKLRTSQGGVPEQDSSAVENRAEPIVKPPVARRRMPAALTRARAGVLLGIAVAMAVILLSYTLRPSPPTVPIVPGTAATTTGAARLQFRVAHTNKDRCGEWVQTPDGKFAYRACLHRSYPKDHGWYTGLTIRNLTADDLFLNLSLQDLVFSEGSPTPGQVQTWAGEWWMQKGAEMHLLAGGGEPPNPRCVSAQVVVESGGQRGPVATSTVEGQIQGTRCPGTQASNPAVSAAE
jgi:hypothetical protein